MVTTPPPWSTSMVTPIFTPHQSSSRVARMHFAFFHFSRFEKVSCLHRGRRMLKGLYCSQHVVFRCHIAIKRAANRSQNLMYLHPMRMIQYSSDLCAANGHKYFINLIYLNEIAKLHRLRKIIAQQDAGMIMYVFIRVGFL